MLDPKDLKAIGELLDKKVRKIVREEIEIESENLQSDLESRMLDHKVHLSGKIDRVSNQIKNVDVKTQKVLKLHEKVDKFLDEEHMQTVRRVKRIEDHLDLKPLRDSH